MEEVVCSRFETDRIFVLGVIKRILNGRLWQENLGVNSGSDPLCLSILKFDLNHSRRWLGKDVRPSTKPIKYGSVQNQ